MFAAWRRQGIPTEYLFYRNEGHVNANPANKRDIVEHFTRWFDAYVLAK